MVRGKEAAKCWVGLGLVGVCVLLGGGGLLSGLAMEVGNVLSWWVSSLCQEPCCCLAVCSWMRHVPSLDCLSKVKARAW